MTGTGKTGSAGAGRSHGSGSDGSSKGECAGGDEAATGSCVTTVDPSDPSSCDEC
jgi:hypothetical protein